MKKLSKTGKEVMDKYMSTKPDAVQKLYRRLPPDRLYRMKATKHVVRLHNYNQNGTVTVLVLRDENPDVLFSRRILEVRPEDLEMTINKRCIK